MADVVFILCLVEDEVWALFVDCVVGEVHHQVVQVGRLGIFVRMGGKSAEPLLIDKDAEWIDAP